MPETLRNGMPVWNIARMATIGSARNRSYPRGRAVINGDIDIYDRSTSAPVSFRQTLPGGCIGGITQAAPRRGTRPSGIGQAGGTGGRHRRWKGAAVGGDLRPDPA